jgi:uncharacterized tellurite resistance protein B-like protein
MLKPHPPEPKRSDPKYQAWSTPAGQEYGFALDHLRWKEEIKQIEALAEAGTPSQQRKILEPEPPVPPASAAEQTSERKSLEEVTIQAASRPQTSNPSEYTIPARDVRGFADQQPRDIVRIIRPKLEPHINGLKSQNKYVRKIAAVALGRSKDPLAVKPLISCLADSDWGVRMQAAQSLGDLGLPEATAALIEALKDTEPYIRRAVCDALGQISDAVAVDALAALVLDEPNEWVRQAAVQALARIKEKTPTYPTANAVLAPVKDAVSAFAAQKVEPLLKACASYDNYYWLPVAKAAILVQVSAESKLTLGQSRQIAYKIQCAGYCIEPDARFSGGTYDWHQTIGVFKSCDNDSTEPSSDYIVAANLLRLCVLVAAADGQIGEVELEVFRQVIENQLALTQTDHRRVQVLEKLLVQNPALAAKTLTKVAKSIPVHKRLLISKVLVRVAASDGLIIKDERRALERIFKMFEISQEMQENLMAQGCPLSKSENFEKSIIAPASTSQGFVLDMDKVYAITNETKEVVGVLSVLMADEPEKSITPPQQAIVPVAEIPKNANAAQLALGAIQFSGLEMAFQPILERLLAHDSWPLADFNALAREFQFMPLNIRDTLNEWSDEALGDFILDGEDPVIIRRELMAKEKI